MLQKISWTNENGEKLELFGNADAIRDVREAIVFHAGNHSVVSALDKEVDNTKYDDDEDIEDVCC